MQAQTLTPAAIFGNHVRYVVPLFQRPYVWTEQDQWAPLWNDIRTVAESLLDAPVTGYGPPPVAPHFLGAIVLDQPMVPSGYIAVRHVIDGQQRLTSLQLVLDAAQWVAEQHGTDMDAKALRVLVLNESAIAQQSHEVFKVWPTDRDQSAFRAAMDNSAVVPADLAGAPIALAHAYFVRAIEAWATAPGDQDAAAHRIRALAQTLREYLKIVVIDLEKGDNAQVIFETLNHRGAPLLAADLIKNLVFQTAAAQGKDVDALYQRYWRDLDDDYWRQKVARGRQYVPRIDIFVNYWLVARFLTEVPADRIFVTFRDRLVSDKLEIEPLLAELAEAAAVYQSLEASPPASPIGRFRYRVLQALDSAVVTPVLLWLLRWPATELSAEQLGKALASLESWLVRRALCRMTSKDINRLTLELLIALDAAGPEFAGDLVERFLLGQSADSRIWPSDEMLKESLRTLPIYKALLRARLRMVLEALEDHRRTSKSESGVCPRDLTVEHLMPQAWREHWNAGLTELQAIERDSVIQTLGNLSLVNQKLNPALSNRPWTDDEAASRGLGSTGKRTELLKHSTLKLNADLVAEAPDRWDEELIRRRTESLSGWIAEIWPRPASDVPELALEQVEKDVLTEESLPSGKYRVLTDWLLTQTADVPPIAFHEVEEILGFDLPPSARTHGSYWYSDQNSLGKAIQAAGFKATGIDLTDERLRFARR